MLPHELEADYSTVPLEDEASGPDITLEDIPKKVQELRKQMLAAAEDLMFEEAAVLRDKIKDLEDAELKWMGKG
jgi:excinuclease ABC subunit B